MISGKRIFISPLDWGLGHATRSIPLIQSLSATNTILLGVTSLNAGFFREHFPQLQQIELPSYKISYSGFWPLWLKLLWQWPRISAVIRKERAQLKRLISKHRIDLVVSDNRFGLSSNEVKCIFITHQLNMKAPLLSGLANAINRRYIHRFSEVWVPDYEAPELRLSGQLSDATQIKIPVKYLGPQSALAEDKNEGERFDCLILLSGVEPQRTLLEEILIKQLEHSSRKIVLVRGKRNAVPLQNTNIKILDLSSAKALSSLIVNSGTVICRSGYSTLMDLHLLQKKKLILIPTPGQTEQEYLGTYWKEKFGAVCIRQKDLIRTDLENLIR